MKASLLSFVVFLWGCIVCFIQAQDVITTIAGNGITSTSIGDGGAATSGTLKSPTSVALDSSGEHLNLMFLEIGVIFFVDSCT